MGESVSAHGKCLTGKWSSSKKCNSAIAAQSALGLNWVNFGPGGPVSELEERRGKTTVERQEGQGVLSSFYRQTLAREKSGIVQWAIRVEDAPGQNSRTECAQATSNKQQAQAHAQAHATELVGALRLRAPQASWSRNGKHIQWAIYEWNLGSPC